MAQPAALPFVAHFTALQDPRQAAKVLYPLPELLLMLLCGIVAGLDPALFKTCFTNWVERLRDPGPETIAVDGKTSRRKVSNARHEVAAGGLVHHSDRGIQLGFNRSSQRSFGPIAGIRQTPRQVSSSRGSCAAWC